ncbi:sensor histidine kinase [Bifidobacterium oedipodis]|uniref:sensor histidine kinase n=1 Tax=Bifidobacterium oedipodis TaxID=2675322 RepID=UPI00145D790E
MGTIALMRGEWSAVFGPAPALLTILTIVTTIAMAWSPRNGAIAIACIWTIAACLPPTAFCVSPMLIINLLFACAVLSASDALLAMAAITIGSLAMACFGTLSGNLHLDTYFGWAMLAIALTGLDLILLIVAITQHRIRTERARMRETEQHHRMCIVTELHDEVATRLSNLTLRLEHDIEVSGNISAEAARTEYGNIRQEVNETLAYTRRIVSLLRDSNAQQSGNGNVSESNRLWLERVRQTMTQQSDRLASLGLTGTILIEDATAHELPTSVADLAVGLINELCANIGKYADRDHGYIVSVQDKPDAIVISTCNTPRFTANAVCSDGKSTGLGLSYYATALERLGGRLDINSGGGQWSVVARIPVSYSNGYR